MRKTEYLHLHGLFVELRRHLRETGDVPPKAFTDYDEYGVAPTGIHYRKDRHHEALDRLRDGVSLTIETRRAAAESRTSDRSRNATPNTLAH